MHTVKSLKESKERRIRENTRNDKRPEQDTYPQKEVLKPVTTFPMQGLVDLILGGF